MVTLTDEVIVTGSSDGLIRVVNIFPNKLLGVIGEHDEFPVERLALSRDDAFLASCSHDCTVKVCLLPFTFSLVKFWNIKFLFEDDSQDEENDNDENGSAKLAETLKTDDERNLKQFFSDL